MIKAKRQFQLSASLICGEHLALGQDLKLLERGGIDALHFDVMDGMFVPRLGLYPELLQGMREKTSLPIHAHLMIEAPERHVRMFVEAGADFVIPHAESTRHLDHTVRLIREAGGRAGVALNPGTPPSTLEYVLPDIELVILMAINPGIVGHKIIPQMMSKIADTRKTLEEYPNIRIEVDGGVSPESAAKMVSLGADILVCGTSSIYRKTTPLNKKVPEFRSLIEKELEKM
jgi:ribulose-phosphate 3-epimerase